MHMLYNERENDHQMSVDKDLKEVYCDLVEGTAWCSPGCIGCR